MINNNIEVCVKNENYFKVLNVIEKYTNGTVFINSKQDGTTKNIKFRINKFKTKKCIEQIKSDCDSLINLG